MNKALQYLYDDLEPAASKAMSVFLEMIRANTGSSRITPEMNQDQIRDCFSHSLGMQGHGLMETLAEFEQKVLPHSLSISNPMYMGLVNSSPLPGAALMDCLVSALDNNAGASHQGPAADACEAEVIRSFSELLGLDAKMTGQFVPGGTYANLHGLLLARTQCADKTGAGYGEMTLYYSEACHFSIVRAAQVIGLTPDQLKPVPTIGRGAMDTDALVTMITEDKTVGLTPCAVVCNLGSTGTGALDPLDQFVDICKQQDLWLHVDACIGGPILLMDEFSGYRDALSQADSFSVDLHKWFYMPLTASLVMTRHPDIEADCFQLEASYIPQGQPEPYQRGLSTSRRSTGLTTWLAIHAYGWQTIESAVRRNIRLTRLLEERLSEAGLNVLPGSELSICCARMNDNNLATDFHERVAENIRHQGTAWFGTVRFEDSTWWRFNILNLYVDESHVHKMADLLLREIGRMTQQQLH